MPYYRGIYILVLIFYSIQINSQNEFIKWYFGANAGLDFSNSPPNILTNGAINTGEGCATICDGSGSLLFSTDGIGVWNSANFLMANGAGLFGNSSSTQSAIIVKQPGNSNLYYIFTVWGNVYYSIVDMSLVAGSGSVTVKNASLSIGTCEKQVAVRHCNGRDIWIITHDYNSNQFRSFLLTSSGISATQITSAIGSTIIGSNSAAIGHLKISPDGKKLAMATWSNSVPSSSGNPGFYLFDFDAASGTISNSLILNHAPLAYGVEFSPDGTKLYGTTSPNSGTVAANFFQWNVCASNNSAITASEYSINLGNIGAGSVQRATDGKIYMAITSSQSLSVINNPNASGAAMGFSANALSIAPKMSGIGLPNYINLYAKPIISPFTNAIACQTSTFAVPAIPSYSSGCGVAPSYSPNAYLWDFGEPSVGAANTSTLSNPVHTYSNTGTYTVTLIMYSNCINDTLKKVITLTTPGPNPTVAGPDVICKGDKITYTVSGGTTYKWFNNSTATTLTLAPTTTTVYSVSATTNGCTLSKTFTVTVNPCTGIDAVQSNGIWRVFPNPFSDHLLVESSLTSKLMLFDLNGSLVLESELNSGHNKINTEQLKAGVYMLKALSPDGAWRAKFVKME